MRRFQKNPGVAVVAGVKPVATSTTTLLSIESMPIEQILKGRYVPSLEEEVAALQEADTAQAEATADVAETTRVEDVTDVMLNVADTLEGAEEITPQQAMLTDTVSEMAVAGSDGDPDDVMPSAADVVEGKVSLESFVDDIRKRAAEIWARIREFCLSIWNTIKTFFRNIFHAAPRLLSRIKQLKDAVAEAKKKGGDAKKKSEVVLLHTGINAVSYPNYMVRTTDELTKGLTDLKALATYTFGAYLKNCKSMGDSVAAELKKFDPKQAGKSLQTVASSLQNNNFTNWPGNPPVGYLGCFDIVAARLDKKKTKDLSDAQIVAALRGSGMKLNTRIGSGAMVSLSSSAVNPKNGFTTMSFTDMDKVLNMVEDLVKQLVASETSADTKAIEKTREALLEGGNHASAEIGKLTGSDEEGKTERAYAMDVMKSLMNFNTSLTRWVTEMTMPVSKKIYQTARSSLVLVEKSVAQYA